MLYIQKPLCTFLLVFHFPNLSSSYETPNLYPFKGFVSRMTIGQQQRIDVIPCSLGGMVERMMVDAFGEFVRAGDGGRWG